jgi:hypothetical protein
MKAAEKRAQLVAKFHEIFKGPPRVEKIATHPESADYWRELVADTGADVTGVEDESISKGGGVFTHSEEPAAAPETQGSLRLVVHHLERPQTVRVETGPEGTEIHLSE